MTRLDRLLEPYIIGPRGSWSYHLSVGPIYAAGGKFTRKDSARRQLKTKLRALITDDDVLVHCLERMHYVLRS